MRKWKHKNIFGKGYILNWFEEVLWLKKLKILLWTYSIEDLKEEITGTFYKKELANKKEFRTEKIINYPSNW